MLKRIVGVGIVSVALFIRWLNGVKGPLPDRAPSNWKQLQPASPASPKEGRRSLTDQYWFRVVVEGLLIGGIVASCTVVAASRIDDARSERELAASERLGWRVTLATAESFQDINLSTADLSGFQLRDRDFSRASFSEADLSRTTLAGSDLVGVDLTDANLSGAVLDGASLLNARVEGANLRGATIKDVDFSGVDLSRTRSLPSMENSTLCYDAATTWPAENGPGRLDWKSCWNGFDDASPPAGARLPPTDLGCDYDDVMRTAFAQYPAVQEGAACAYLAYLGSKGGPGLDTDRAITGAFICKELGAGDTAEAYSFARAIDDDPSELDSKNVLLAAATLLCPEQSQSAQTLLKGFS